MRWEPIHKLKPTQDGQPLLTTDGHIIKLCCMLQGTWSDWNTAKPLPDWRPTHFTAIRLPSNSERKQIDHSTPILVYLRALYPAGASRGMISNAVGCGNPKRFLREMKRKGLVKDSMDLDDCGVPYRRWMAACLEIERSDHVGAKTTCRKQG